MIYKRKDESGFTLVELVIAVSILVIFTGAGLLTYNNILNDQKQSSLDLAAQTVVNDAVRNVIDFDDSSDAQMAVDEWNNNGSYKDFVAETFIESREVSIPQYNYHWEYTGDAMVVQDCVNVRVSDSGGKLESIGKNDKLCGVE